MAKAPVKDNYLTFVGVSDQRAEPAAKERDLAAELFRKSYQGQVVDQFERNMHGAPKQKKKNLEYKFKLFAPEYKDDLTLLNSLMNNPKYSIIQWKDNWTVEGLYRIAVIYATDIDFKDPEQQLKDIADGTTN